MTKLIALLALLPLAPQSSDLELYVDGNHVKEKAIEVDGQAYVSAWAVAAITKREYRFMNVNGTLNFFSPDSEPISQVRFAKYEYKGWSKDKVRNWADRVQGWRDKAVVTLQLLKSSSWEVGDSALNKEWLAAVQSNLDATLDMLNRFQSAQKVLKEDPYSLGRTLDVINVLDSGAETLSDKCDDGFSELLVRKPSPELCISAKKLANDGIKLRNEFRPQLDAITVWYDETAGRPN